MEVRAPRVRSTRGGLLFLVNSRLSCEQDTARLRGEDTGAPVRGRQAQARPCADAGPANGLAACLLSDRSSRGDGDGDLKSVIRLRSACSNCRPRGAALHCLT